MNLGTLQLSKVKIKLTILATQQLSSDEHPATGPSRNAFSAVWCLEWKRVPTSSTTLKFAFKFSSNFTYIKPREQNKGNGSALGFETLVSKTPVHSKALRTESSRRSELLGWEWQEWNELNIPWSDMWCLRAAGLVASTSLTLSGCKDLSHNHPSRSPAF